MISFLPGRERSEVSEAWALRYIVQPAIAVETAASANQTASHSAKLFCCEATSAAKRAVTPMETCPQPGTAVNDEARSIAARMKRRLSIARSCSAGGSSASGFWKGWTTAMLGGKYTAATLLSSALCGKAKRCCRRAKRVAPRRPTKKDWRDQKDAATVAAASRFDPV